MKNKLSIALSLAVILAVAGTSLALADNMVNDVVSVPASITLTAGVPSSFVDVQFWIQPTSNDGDPQCNFDSPSEQLIFSINTPSGVTANPSSLTFTKCKEGANLNAQTVRFSAGASAVSGNISFTTTFNNSGGSFDYSAAVFYINVVIPNTPPAITVNDVTKEGNTTGGWTLAFADIGSASDAEDGTPSVSCTPAIGSILPLGATFVTCTATDSGGLTATDSGTVTVVDTTAPSIADNPDLTLEATGPSGAAATFDNPAASDIVDSNVSVVCAPASGSTFAFGHTTVTCTATDDSGNSAQSDFDVFVQDTTPPTIEAHADVGPIEATGPSGAVVNYTSPATHDLVDGDGVATCAPASGNLFPLGDTTVTCNATDAAGNSATPTTFVVHVVDTTDPTFSCGSADGIWHPDDQSVACTASDSGSGLATPAAFNLSTSVPADAETDSAYTDSQNVCDLAGNCVTAGPIGPFKIDKKAPSVSASPDRPADFGGWYNHALTITFTGTDGGSGLASCDPAVNYSGPDDASALVSGSCTDNVGNSASADFNFMYDATYPTAALSVTAGTPGANGWYTSDVTVHTSGTGSVSGVTCTADQYQTAETTGATFNGSCTSGAGLTTNAAPLTIKLDKTGPTAVLSASGTLGNNGWYVSDVTISTSGSDDISAPVTCTADQFQTTDTSGTEFNGSCTNDAGLTRNADPLTIKRDATAPLISANISPARPASGWWNIGSGAPTVSFTCSDATSGVAGSCPSAYTFSEGENQTYSQTIYDHAGNSASAGVSDIDVDLTAPTLTWSNGPANGGVYDFGFVPSAPTCTAADALSGPNGCTVGGYGSAAGSHTITATAHDNAGNSSSENRTYTVLGWALRGFYQPVDMNGIYNIVKNGATVPLKFEIFTQVSGVELTDVAFVKSLIYTQTACSASVIADDIETLATGGTVMRYDAVSGQFIFNWKTPSGAGKCYRVTMTTTDGSSLVAYFKMK